MKIFKILFFLFVLCGILQTEIEAQKKGKTTTPYSTEGWDTPYGQSQYFRLNIFRLLSNPGGYININTRMIDSLFNELIVLLDTTQFVIENDTLKHSPYSSGVRTFTTTSKVDSFTVTGLKATDVFTVSPVDSAVAMSVSLKTNKAIVRRSSGTLSGQKYYWLWRRRY